MFDMSEHHQIILHDRIERKIDELKKRQTQLEEGLDIDGIGPGQVETLLNSWIEAEKEVVILTLIQAKHR